MDSDADQLLLLNEGNTADLTTVLALDTYFMSEKCLPNYTYGTNNVAYSIHNNGKSAKKVPGGPHSFIGYWFEVGLECFPILHKLQKFFSWSESRNVICIGQSAQLLLCLSGTQRQKTIMRTFGLFELSSSIY